MLASHAQKAGARLLENVTVTGPMLDERTGRITGVTARETGRQAEGPERAFSARLVDRR